MRITKTEKGKAYSRTETKAYVLTYTQPLHNYIISRLYHHIWERLTWRIYRIIEKLLRHKESEEWFYIPLTNRQDLRCEYLSRKGRITVRQDVY